MLNARQFDDLAVLWQTTAWWLANRCDVHVHDTTTGRPPLELIEKAYRAAHSRLQTTRAQTAGQSHIAKALLLLACACRTNNFVLGPKNAQVGPFLNGDSTGHWGSFGRVTVADITRRLGFFFGMVLCTAA